MQGQPNINYDVCSAHSSKCAIMLNASSLFNLRLSLCFFLNVSACQYIFYIVLLSREAFWNSIAAQSLSDQSCKVIASTDICYMYAAKWIVCMKSCILFLFFFTCFLNDVSKLLTCIVYKIHWAHEQASLAKVVFCDLYVNLYYFFSKLIMYIPICLLAKTYSCCSFLNLKSIKYSFYDFIQLIYYFIILHFALYLAFYSITNIFPLLSKAVMLLVWTVHVLFLLSLAWCTWWLYMHLLKYDRFKVRCIVPLTALIVAALCITTFVMLVPYCKDFVSLGIRQI